MIHGKTDQPPGFLKPMDHIKHIERAKTWTVVLAFIFVSTIATDLFHLHRQSQDTDSWFYGAGEFRQNGQVISNKGVPAESGIWISGRSYDLQRRGKPRWAPNLIGLIAVIQIFRHLRKGYSMPEPKRKEE